MNIKDSIPGAYTGEKILFYVTEVAHFWDSIQSLFYKYLEKRACCTVVFPTLTEMKAVGRGERNVERMQAIMGEIRRKGAECYYQNEWDGCQKSYDICFTASDYISINPKIKKYCRYIVALQITAIYTHVYVGASNIHQLFGGENCIDYFVVSKFVTDWLKEKMDIPHGKLLSFGYPRLDDLYKNLQAPVNLPSGWSKKINGKKVFFVVGGIDYPYWLPHIKTGVIIYRPHPFQIEREAEEGILEKLRSLENVIIDDTEKYYDSFKIADALISPILCSLATNFLMTDKPVLLLDNAKFDCTRTQHVLDYKKEAWYNASYIAKEENDIEMFVEMVDAGKDWLFEEHKPYREYMQQHFDGKVCERIIDYFDKK